MAQAGDDKSRFADSPWLMEVVRATTGSEQPTLIAIGFHTLMKRSATGGFVGQLARDVAGVAVGGLPGLALTSGSASSVFFGNVVIFLYFKDRIVLVDIGYQSLVGDDYEEVTLPRDCLRKLEKGEADTKITSIMLENLQLDYEELEAYSLAIAVNQPGAGNDSYKYPLKITFPIAKVPDQAAAPRVLRGTAYPSQIIDMFHGTVGFPDPKELSALFVAVHASMFPSKLQLPKDGLLIEMSANDYFMEKFMVEYNKSFGFTRKKLLIKLFPTLPAEFRESVKRQFLRLADGDKHHSTGVKWVRYIGIAMTLAGFAYVPFNFTEESIGLSGMMVLIGVLIWITHSLLADKVNSRKWYAKHLAYFDD